MIIGVTGGIGSGKTTVSDFFAHKNIAVIDADIVARMVVEKEEPLLATLRRVFGGGILDSAGNYNRPAMRAQVFDNPDKLAQLNALMHPAIVSKITEQLKNTQSPYTLMVVPLLFDAYAKTGKPSQLMQLCQHFLVINASEQAQIARANRRDSATDVAQILKTQLPQDQRLSIAHQLHADIIDNNGNISDLYAQLEILHHKYLTMASIAKSF